LVSLIFRPFRYILEPPPIRKEFLLKSFLSDLSSLKSFKY
jgi:hypothetical protein